MKSPAHVSGLFYLGIKFMLIIVLVYNMNLELMNSRKIFCDS
jgi:hypothetical protein